MRVLLLSARLREERRLPFKTIDQFTDAGTAIASNLSEAQSSITRKRMAWYYSIALGEARETTTWLRVLQAVGYGDPSEVAWLLQEASEFVAMLTVSLKKLRNPPS